MLALMPAEGRHPACTCRIVGDAPFPGISGYTGRLGLVGLDLSAIPDLDDPATAGVIVGMLAGTGRLHHIDSPRTNGRGWLVVIFDGAPGHEAFTDTSLGRAAARAWLGVRA